jgi:phenylacetate-coenzyme A ligase PaaK-like adenylate-forming protein
MATTGYLQDRGHKEIKSVKADRIKLRKACKKIAKESGDKLEAMTPNQYRWHIRRALENGIFWQKVAKQRENKANRLDSLNPVKAARMKALREAWAKVTKAAP